VHTFSGHVMELVMGSKDTVLGLQHKIGQQWDIPPSCIVVLVGMDIVEDTRVRLGDVHAGDSSPLIVTAVISIEPLQWQALKATPKERVMAVDDLLRVASRDYQKSVEVFSECLSDHVITVRSAAIDALAKIARKGDQVAIQALTTRLNDTHVDLRQDALEALGPLLDWDDGCAIDALTRCLTQNAHPEIKAKAITLIGDEAPHGQAHAIHILTQCLEDAFANVRCMSVIALEKIAMCGDQSVVLPLCRRACWDEEWKVRVSAITALANLAPYGDGMTISVARELLGDADKRVQSAAEVALSSLMDLEFQGIEVTTPGCFIDCAECV